MPKISELIIDAYGCESDLSDLKGIEKAARASVETVGARIAHSASYRFQPHGLTLCLILMESHFIVSTWPEHQYAVTNIFLCNQDMDPKTVWHAFAPSLRATKTRIQVIEHDIRGQLKAA